MYKFTIDVNLIPIYRLKIAYPTVTSIAMTAPDILRAAYNVVFVAPVEIGLIHVVHFSLYAFTDVSAWL